MASIEKGREGREKYGSLKGKKNKEAPSSTTNREKARNKPLMMILASGAEWWAWLVGKQPGLTRYRVTYSCVSRCHNIEKARRVLGYEPKVGMEEGLRRTLEVRATQAETLCCCVVLT